MFTKSKKEALAPIYNPSNTLSGQNSHSLVITEELILSCIDNIITFLLGYMCTLDFIFFVLIVAILLQ